MGRLMWSPRGGVEDAMGTGVSRWLASRIWGSDCSLLSPSKIGGLDTSCYRTLLPIPFMLNLAGWQNIDFAVVLFGISGHDDLSDNTNHHRADFAPKRNSKNFGDCR
jgi:hypothetical protein